MIYNFELFVGYRKYSGTEENTYDWWHDYKSDIAWNPKFAGYYWYKKIKLD